MTEIEKKTMGNGAVIYVIKGTSLLHREDGPARIYGDDKVGYWNTWYKNNVKHREDGPADYCTGLLGETHKDLFYLNGIQVNSYEELIIKNIIE